MSAALPGWADDERLARAAWSRLVEPGDPVAGPVLDHVGAVGLLHLVLSGRPVPAGLVASSRARELVCAGLERWRVRVATVDPERDVATTERLGGRLLVPGDAEWPAGLDDLGHAAPACLWVRGPAHLARASARSLALVGARASTAYGDRTAAELAAGLADRGIGVVSGGAYGIDAAAHEGALAAGGTTVAVLACGVDRAYPAGNEDLLSRVRGSGAVVAEVAPGSAPTRHRFLQRNRLIAALTGATVVVEAAWRSGALSTASHAAGLLRPVGAVPGPVTSAASAGCHRLLREAAATCITDAAEAAELVEPVGTALPAPRRGARADHDGLAAEDLRVLDALPVRAARATSALAQVAGLPEPQVVAALGRLGLLGLAESPGGGAWRRARRAGAGGGGA